MQKHVRVHQLIPPKCILFNVFGECNRTAQRNLLLATFFDVSSPSLWMPHVILKKPLFENNSSASNIFWQKSKLAWGPHFHSSTTKTFILKNKRKPRRISFTFRVQSFNQKLIKVKNSAT